MEQLIHKIELLELLVKGCRVHPAYRAIRPATGNCVPCVDMGKQNKNSIILQISEPNVAMMPVVKVLVVAETCEKRHNNSGRVRMVL